MRSILALIFLVGFLPSSHAFLFGFVDTKKCSKSRGKFPKPGSLCRSYYECKNWKPKEVTCPEDQHFFPKRGYCVWPEEYPCVEKLTAKECLLPNGKFLKSGTGCKKYYDCKKGISNEKKCAADLLFDSVREKCDWPELVHCPEAVSTTENPSSPAKSTVVIITTESKENSSEEGSSSPEDSSSIEDDKSTSSNLFTSNSSFDEKVSTDAVVSSIFTEETSETRLSSIGKISQMPTASSVGESSQFPTRTSSARESSKLPTTVSNINESSKLPTTALSNEESSLLTTTLPSMELSSKSEDRDMMSTVSKSVDSSTVNIFCPERDGYFPHPNDKHKFIACVAGDLIVMECPSNLVYVHRKRACDYQKI